MTSIVHKGRLQVEYREGTADEQVIAHSFERDMYLRTVPEFVLRPNVVIIEIGAHIGAFALYVGSKAPQGKIYAIEACRETYELLERNVKRNELKSVIPVRLALSDREGTTKLFYNQERGNWGHCIAAPVSATYEEVPCDTLAHFMDRYRIDVGTHMLPARKASNQADSGHACVAVLPRGQKPCRWSGLSE